MANPTTRRNFLTSTAALSGLALGSTALAACGGNEESGSSTTAAGGGTSQANSVWFDNWTEYIDTPNGDLYGPGGTLDTFQKQTGISIKYTEDINDNDEYFAKIQPLLSKGEPIGPNVIAPTFWLAGRLLQLGWLDKLPLAQIPNAANLVPSLQKPPSDPTGEYSLPWQSGMAGIAYNQAVTGRELTSMDDLWDPAFRGKIGVLTEMRDTIGLIAMSLGIDLANPNDQDYQPAFAKLEEEVTNGQIRQFTGNDYIDDLQLGNFAACVGWSGDVLGLNNPDIKFAIPESGGTLWFDTMVIPAGSQGVDAVAQWMNFVYDPVNAARITAGAPFISPVQGVQEELRKMGGDAAALADNQLLFPDASTLERLQSWGTLSDEKEEQMSAEFSRIKGA